MGWRCFRCRESYLRVLAHPRKCCLCSVCALNPLLPARELLSASVAACPAARGRAALEPMPLALPATQGEVYAPEEI